MPVKLSLHLKKDETARHVWEWKITRSGHDCNLGTATGAVTNLVLLLPLSAFAAHASAYLCNTSVQAQASIPPRRDAYGFHETVHDGDGAILVVERSCTATQKAPASGGLLDCGSSARNLSDVV